MKFDPEVVKFLEGERDAYKELARNSKDTQERMTYLTCALALTTTLNKYVCTAER